MTVQLVECPDTWRTDKLLLSVCLINSYELKFKQLQPLQLPSAFPNTQYDSPQLHPPQLPQTTLMTSVRSVWKITLVKSVWDTQGTETQTSSDTSTQCGEIYSGRGWRELEASCVDATSAVLAPNRQAVHRLGCGVAADEAISIDALVLFLTGCTSFARRIGSDYSPVSLQIPLLLFFTPV